MTTTPRLALILLAISVMAAGQSAKQPIYIQLFTRSVDHVNLELTEQRIERYLPLIERYRKEYPQYGSSLLCLFSGTVSESLAQRNRVNHVVDLVLAARKKGLVETGYDGSEEPTPMTRPRPNFRGAKTPQQRWAARAETADWFLTEYKHFITGEPDPERSGGLKRMLEVFGEASFITGVTGELGGDPEVVHQLCQMNSRFVMPGVPERESFPARNVEGFRGGSKAFGEIVSPAPDCSPEVYWHDGVLRLSDSSGEPVKVIRAEAGPEELKKFLDGLDRSRIHVIRLELGHPSIYLKPDFENSNPSPLRYAYDTPKLPRLPQEAFRTQAEIDAAFGREVASIHWLAGQFMPANLGSRWVLPGDLVRMAQTSAGSGIPSVKLRKAVENLTARWKVIGNHPPEWVAADGEYFSLADMFQMLAVALAVRHGKGVLPDSVQLKRTYGPWEMVDGQGPAEGAVSVSAIGQACAELLSSWESSAWKQVPENAIPAWITVDGVRLNAAQFLRLMAEAFLSPSVDGNLNVKTCQMFHAPAMALPTTRRAQDTGTTWTIKPARLGPF